LTVAKYKNSTLALVCAIALSALVANHLVKGAIHREALHQALQQQERVLHTFRELLRGKGQQFRADAGTLWAGDYPINGNNEIPDKVLAITGSAASVLLGATGIATSELLPDGRRALGARLAGAPFRALYRKGVPYRGEATVLGVPYFTAYDPIRDARGTVVGALFVGVREGDFLSGYQRIAARIRWINYTLGAAVALFAVLLLCERRRAEEELRKQLSLMRILSDTIPSPIYSKDIALRYSGSNSAFQSFVGVSGAELTGKTAHEMWPRELAELYDRMDRELLSGPSGTQVYETKIRHADGSLRDVVLNKARICNRQGLPEGVIGVMLDITERKAAEEELRSAYRRTADIVEFLPDGAFVLDRERRVIAWNRALEEMTGVRKEQMLGRGDGAYAIPFFGEPREMLIDLLEAEPAVIRERYQNGGREGRSIFGEIRLTGYRGGEDRTFRGAATQLLDRDGNRSGAIQTMRDITELLRAAQQRQNLAAQRRYSRMMESLMVQLSHDLNTPLTPLFALLPMLQRGVADPKLQRMLEICQNSAGQIQALAVKSLELVRLSSEQSRPELVPVPLAAAAESALHEVAPCFEERAVGCTNRIDPALRALAAPDQLTLLLRNLLTNAARYAAPGGRVEIGATPAGATVTLWVRDDGIGLDPDYGSLIFSEFFKGDRARKDLNTQGLGLAICQRIVLNHGGRIWAHSRGKGEGTTIFFTLAAAPPAHQGEPGVPA
jgi:PAS domain S-box-containing protein